MIHKYNLNGRYILLDVNSGGVFSIDKITYHVLDHYPRHNRNETVKILKCQYSSEALQDCINEIDFLIESDELFSKGIAVNNKLKNNSTIKAICLHISHDCNMRCKYCFASQGNFQGDKLLMSEEVGKKAIDFLITNSQGRRNLEIDFFGGEPLMNMDVVEKLVEYAKKQEKECGKNFRFTLTTNGVLLDDKNMHFINENMNNVVLSLDGRKEINDAMRYTPNGKGTYEYIVKKIKKMVDLRKDKDYYVRGTFTKYNLDFSNDIFHLAELGFKNISVEPVVTKPTEDYAITKDELPRILREYEKLAESYCKNINNNHFNFFHFNVDLEQGPCLYKRISGCGAGSDYIAITPQGELYPCHQFVGNETFRLGTLETGITNTNCQQQFYEANLTDKEDCTQCWAKYYCGGGCLANAYHANGDIKTPDKIGCEMEKKRIECAIMVKLEQIKNSDA
ncbi:MAG: thioether cross-link-forming SCIFF peptide maturase [Eubacteriales bacterium]